MMLTLMLPSRRELHKCMWSKSIPTTKTQVNQRMQRKAQELSTLMETVTSRLDRNTMLLWPHQPGPTGHNQVGQSCLRIILGSSARRQKRNTETGAAANIDTTEAMMRQRHLRRLGHVSGMGTECTPRYVVVDICKWKGGKQKAGGQRLRLSDIVSRPREVSNW